MGKKDVTIILEKNYSSHPGDIKLFIILAINHKGEFVTWLYNEEFDGLSEGHYFGVHNKGTSAALREALDDYDKRGVSTP